MSLEVDTQGSALQHKWIGYHWEVKVTRKTYKPNPDAPYKGGSDEATFTLGGNTETIEKLYNEFIGAKKSLGV